MDTTNGPIKRSPYLVPFSREHHDVLLFVWKIRQGLRNEIPVERIIPYGHWYFETYMKDHFQTEEEGFKNIIPSSHPMLVQMTEDHRKIETAMAGLSPTAIASDLENLAALIETHIRFEERKLFGVLEAMATPEQLEKLTAATTKGSCNQWEWNDAFWKKPV
jgi:hypothetical protein